MKLDPRLYGHNGEENIVGIHELGDGSTVVYYTRDADEVTEHRDTVYPFGYLSVEGAEKFKDLGIKATVKRLKGDLHYPFIVVTENLNDLRDIRRGLGDGFYSVGSVVSQYLMQTGKTLFKGMTPKSIKRMQLDIETYSSTDGMSNADRAEDEVIIIAMSDNRGFERVLHTSERMRHLGEPYVFCGNEPRMLIEMVKTIHRVDPDVIELHNGFGFDLPYLRDRCARYNVNFAIGRTGRKPRTYKSKKTFAEREYEYEKFLIDGRAIIDTMFLAVDYDVYKRDLPGLGLKVVAQHFGVAPEDREYVPGDQISKVWDEDPERLLKYALHDVYETRGISDMLCQSIFYLTQMVPMDYQAVHSSGKSGIIQSLFLRQYLRERYSIPKPMKGRQESGGYTEIFKRGVYEDLCYADVESLYPSIMLTGGGIGDRGNEPIQPKSDELKLFSYFLRRLTDLRFDAKRRMKALPKDHPERQELDARQSSYKILINSFYGLLSFARGVWNDYDEGERVAYTGRLLLKKMFGIIESKGGRPVLCDTDGILFQLPRKGMTDAEVDELVDSISAEMPEGINVGNDGRFERVLSYRKKNYILQEPGGKVIIKGGSFKSRMIEPFGREYVKKVALCLLRQDVEAAYRTHREFVRMIYERDWSPDDFCKRATIKASLDEYQRKLAENDNKNPQAQYELALALRKRGIEIYPGDTIEYYVSGDCPKSRVTVYEQAKLKSEWTPGDENTNWYLGSRLKKFASKFAPFFTKEDFDALFNCDPDAADIEVESIAILNTVVKTEPDE